MYVGPSESDQLPADSAFVYGKNETATSTLAVALAVKRQASFSWADCAAPKGRPASGEHAALVRGRPRRTSAGVDPEELTTPPWSTDLLDRLLVPEDGMDYLRLVSYLALPRLLQELAAMSTAPSGESGVILTNIHALDPELRASILGRIDVHRRLHEVGVALYVTATDPPTQDEMKAFDRVLRVESPQEDPWSAATVVLEKGWGAFDPTRTKSLRAVWNEFELDPTLLPPD